MDVIIEQVRISFLQLVLLLTFYFFDLTLCSSSFSCIRYYHDTIKRKYVSANTPKWHGLYWTDISPDEMHRFLGILLKISLEPIDFGGYTAYFRSQNIKINLTVDSSTTFEVPSSRGFISLLHENVRMSLNRFKQIRGAFHPEDKGLANGTEDKCYQLRLAMNELNAASLSNFVPEANCSFDEGGVACRSRYCPVRQYNKDKPDKFRVDFFILAGSKSYIIYHIDVYQGRNAANIGIDEACINLPTTMKAVANAVIKSQLGNGCDDVNGYRVVSLDNRYQCPQLAFLIWDR
jgi:hypothetical protein